MKTTSIAGDGAPGDGDITDRSFAPGIYNENAATQDTPIIDVNVPSLKFTTITEGRNPADQTFTINNAGIGAVDWTVSDKKTNGVSDSRLRFAIA